MRRGGLRSNSAGVVTPLAVFLLIVSVVGIVAVGWRVTESVNKTEESNANASVVGATLRIYQNQSGADTTTKWVEYRNDKLGFSFKFPPEWGNARVATDSDNLFLLLFDNKDQNGPKLFKGELRATNLAAPFTDNAVARGYMFDNGLYFRRVGGDKGTEITSEILSILTTKAGRIVMFKETVGVTMPVLTALINLNKSSAFSGINFIYGDNYSAADAASFKKVLQTFTYTN